MADSWNCGFLANNQAPNYSVLTTTSGDADWPVANIVNGYAADPFLAGANSTKVRADMGANINFTCVGVIGHNMADGDTINLNTYTAGDWATGLATTDLEPNWITRTVYKDVDGTLTPVTLANIYDVFGQMTKQYIELELSGSTPPRVGEWFIGTSFQQDVNFKWGAHRIGHVNKRIKIINGIIDVRQKNERIGFRLDFENVSRANWWEIFHFFRGYKIILVPDYDELECLYGAVTSDHLDSVEKYPGDSFSMEFWEDAL